ncbi:hypothetical protein K466DRAFT_490099 [Polyporus arcularius HHB13444]|uniref:protein-tyrosine-phosphatase n=1 Tax=Polyporus arcularius HHB13444 TaxID=1314778 RepID=A0A5C3PPD8_9APHY|nr:hypothetical protein K466DRAFT_490099 [Polyporus arcularius HHB13444]
MPPSKGRPPNLRLHTNAAKTPSNTIIELETPVDRADDDDDLLQLSSPSTASSSPVEYASAVESDSDPTSDDISKELALLDRLRRSVRKNLKLRPIRSATNIRAQAASPFSSSWTDLREARSPSPSSSAASPASVYYTPTSALHADVDDWRSSSSDSSVTHGIDAAVLVARLAAPTRPILIDTRPTAEYLANHLEHSVNIHTIPSLILKRSRKPGGGLHDVSALRQWITTDDGKRKWDDIMNSGDWDGDVIVYAEHMDEKDRTNPQATAWILLKLVEPLLEHGTIDYLHGGFSTALRHPYLKQRIVSDRSRQDSHRRPPTKAQKANGKPGGLFQLDISVATRPRDLPELERSAVSPKPMMPTAITSWQDASDPVAPSPAPSQLGFTRPPPPRRPSVPTLRKLDTTSTERLNANLPKLQMPHKSATLAAPPSASGLRSRSRSPSHLRLDLPPLSPPGSARLLSASPGHSSEFLPPPSPSWAQPSTPRMLHSPSTPMSRSPSTARPESSQPPTTEEPFPAFAASTILPNFLFLGPELTAEEHVEELLSLGVKRILNLAAECDDDQGLHLRERFERYIRIPMRDTVEEDNITRGVREVCEILDDARLHSAPTYVHCKAGKSRSVTAVMAYLIHANHWTLSRAYSFVLERRKGISPNIGFVSELMTFEEQELGGKSVGVVKVSEGEEGEGDGGGAGGGGGGSNYQVALGSRRPQHIRESLPPLFSMPHSFAGISSSTSNGPPVLDAAHIGDSGQELEIKDATGRYRHARRAPVDEATLQPMRRVSKAGLESSSYV